MTETAKPLRLLAHDADDLGVLSAGGVTVPIYPSNLADEVQYVADHSGGRVVFAENGEQVDKLIDAGLGDSSFVGFNAGQQTDSLTTYRDWLQARGGVSIYV